MGTRCDFYVIGPYRRSFDTPKSRDLSWIGSLAWDGLPSEISPRLDCSSLEAFTRSVRELVDAREDGTSPDLGWPWGYDTSSQTGFVYAWDDSLAGVVVAIRGDGWVPLSELLEWPREEFGAQWAARAVPVEFPSMTPIRQEPAPGDPRSGTFRVLLSDEGPIVLGLLSAVGPESSRAMFRARVSCTYFKVLARMKSGGKPLSESEAAALIGRGEDGWIEAYLEYGCANGLIRTDTQAVVCATVGPLYHSQHELTNTQRFLCAVSAAHGFNMAEMLASRRDPRA